jgi:hypothetical protein
MGRIVAQMSDIFPRQSSGRGSSRPANLDFARRIISNLRRRPRIAPLGRGAVDPG